MRYPELSYTEFYSCYLQQCHSIDFFSYRAPGHGEKGRLDIRSVRPSVQKFSWNWLFSFLWDSTWC